MSLPNFLGIGAGRSGTTSLHFCLRQHPEIFLSPEKSPNFFVAGDEIPGWERSPARAMTRQWIADRSRYEELFGSVTNEKAVGEISPVYLQSRMAPRRIADLCPDARLVAILRDPVERAFAHFVGRRRDGLERRSDFSAVVAEELARPLPEDVAFGCYLGASRYHHFLSEYYRSFPDEQIRVFLFEDLQQDFRGLLREVYEFLGVDSEFEVPTTRRYNESGEIRNPLLRFLWTHTAGLRTWARPMLSSSTRTQVGGPFLRRLAKPVLAPELRAELVPVLRDDIESLQGLIGRDLSAWLDPDRDRPRATEDSLLAVSG